MQKLFELTSKDFLSGLSVSGHMPTSGLFSEASGINPFRNPYTSSYDMGLLQTSAAFTDISTNVVDNIIGGTFNGSVFRGYLMGDAGHFYELNTSNYAAPTDLRSGTPITNPTDGIEIYQVNGGTKYLYYFQRTQIGRWDLSGSYPTGWSDNYIGSGGSGYTVALQSTDIRPTHLFVGNLYYGNKDRVGAITDPGTGSIGHDEGALDLPSDLTIVTLDDDGYYLVIGATSNTIAGNLQVNTLNKIYFWDTVSNSWAKEYALPVANIISIKRNGDLMYALTSDGLYVFSFALPPTLILPLSNADTGARVGGVSPTDDIACVKNGVFYWLSGGSDICAYGEPLPGLKPKFYRPFKHLGTVGTYMAYPDKFRIITGSTSNKLGELNTASGGATSRTAETAYIDLGAKFEISRIELTFGEPLASGDEINIDLQSDEDTTAVDYGTASFTTHGAIRSRVLTPDSKLTADSVKVLFNFNGGNVKVKRICAYGELTKNENG